MKSFNNFKQDIHEALPAVLAAPYALPALTFAAGAAANVLKAKRQGQGGRSQPVDYGQGGETKPRTPNVQRPSGKLSAAEVQRRQALADRRADAQDRADTSARQGIDRVLGTDAERAAAKRARENQPQIQRDLRRAAQRARMDAAARRNNLGESVNISGDFNGNLYINSQPEQQVEESYVADILWEGNLYRLELKGRMPSKDQLAENLQSSYPGALVQQIYPVTESNLDIKSAKRYHPAKLDWV